MGFQDISNDLEVALQDKLGCKFSYLLMKYKDKKWHVEGTAKNLTDIRSKFYEARTNYGPKTIIEVIPYPDIEKLNEEQPIELKVPDKKEIKKLHNIKEESEEVVICSDDSCMAYDLEKNNEWLINFIESYIKHEK